ncbi:MAG: hypothetical protein JWM16_5905, partial [Verrucomicrobiales bacterium]|nr:hypothetical protein [Verrucomicrobiales bacterium]
MHNMNYKTRTLASIAVGIFVTGLANSIGHAQSSDALLNKLVEKGVLNKQEADQLKKETAQESQKDFSKAFQAKTGMPEWVTSLKFGGDFRGRFEGFYNDDRTITDRNRFRYRLRFGTVATLKDDFEVGLRLSSSDPARGGAGQAGDPVSGNTTLTDNGSKKGIYVDLAYAKWTGIKFDNFSGSLTIGKMEDPFVYSSMLFDHDYTPEGIAGQLNYKIGDHHALKLVGAGFSVLEIGGSSYDSVVVGSQLRLDSAWTPRIFSSAGVGIITLLNENKLLNSSIPNQNAG